MTAQLETSSKSKGIENAIPLVSRAGVLSPFAIIATVLVLGLSACTGHEQPKATPTSAPLVSVEAEGDATAGLNPRDWERCPAIAEISSAGDLLVVGDVHGDWEKLRDLLLGSEVLAKPAPAAPEEAVWSAEDATLVFVGDFSGKFPQSLQVIALLQNLGAQARAAGGQVIATLGNHEAEFLAPEIVDGKPQWAKKTDLFRQELVDNGLDPEDVWLARGSERSRELGQFLNCLPAAAVSDHWFFAHAGSTEGRTLDVLRQAIEDGVEADGYRTAVLLDKATGLLEARLAPDPPTNVWWQELPESQEQSRRRLETYASTLGVRHIVIGHQAGKYEFNHGIVRKKARMFQLFDGTLYLTDVGMSRGQKGGLSAGALLHIEREADAQSVSVVCPDGRRRPLPPEGTSEALRCKLP